MPLPSAGTREIPALEELAHELRQPLSTIESLAYYLELIVEDPGICVHLRQIQEMVLAANDILEHASFGPSLPRPAV